MRLHNKIILFIIVLFTVLLFGIGGLMLIKTFGHEGEGQDFDIQVHKIEPADKPSELAQSDESSISGKEIIETEDVSGDKAVSVILAGDICLDESYAHVNSMKLRGGRIEDGISLEALDIMRNADVFAANLECAISDRGVPTEDKQYTIRAGTKMTPYLTDMGLDLAFLANNHCYDYGEEALLDTFAELQKENIVYTGAGKNFEEASKPVIYEIKGLRIGFINSTQIEKLDNPDTPGATDSRPGTFRCWYDDRVVNLVKETKGNCDYLIAYIHWGNEMEEEPDWAQLQLAEKLAAAGADIVVGDHPHVLQRIDYIGDTPIVYSLGNYWFNSKNRDSMLLQLEINPAETKIKIIPVHEPDIKTSLALGEDGDRILDYLRGLSENVIIDEEGFIAKK